MRDPFMLEFFYAIVMRGAGKPRLAGLCGVRRRAGGRPLRAVPTLVGNKLRDCHLKSVNQGKSCNKIFMDR
jgi:hypothetical protein